MTPWIQDWADALESGYFRQIPDAKDQWDPEGRYSALGVLCEINGCKRNQVYTDPNRVRVVYNSLVEKGYANSYDDFVSYIKQNKTQYMYGTGRGNECLSYIPIDLTSKLKCNACLDVLGNGIRGNYEIHINMPNIIQDVHPNVASLDSAGVPFAAIAEFVRDVWVELTFNDKSTLAPKTLTPKDYGYFELKRV
jgi:hypothetical protein